MKKTCGALTGAFMVLGMKYGNSDPKDLEAKLNACDMVRKTYCKIYRKTQYGRMC